MGQKINPTGFRLSVSRNWTSRWYANNNDFANMLKEDVEVRNYLKKKLKNASVSKVLIERPAKNARITIFSSRPGVVIGKKGEDIEVLRKELQKRMGVPVHVNIEEIRKPEVDAQLIADSITQQLEKRIMFRRAMKRAMQSAMRLGAQGIKIMSSGRLNGAEIARGGMYTDQQVHTAGNLENFVINKENLDIFAIINVVATKQNGKIVLTNYQKILTKNWKTKTVGSITYHYFPEYQINEENALKANEFLNTISSTFELKNEKINYTSIIKT